MCGLAGLVRFTAPRVDESVAGALDAALAHRGPDGRGVFASPRALLVHRRLAIIDLTPAASQPMSYAEGRYQFVFNGEVYNYRSLRSDLERRGERFATGSDTEVLLRLVVLDGPAALARVRGMFALALWDDAAGTLTLARDRFGIKPLYVAHDTAGVGFASEVGALRRAGLVSRDISPAGMLAYLSWGSVPAPLTWLRGAEALEPGTWRTWSSDGSVRSGRFADSASAYRTNGQLPSEQELRETVGEAVRDAVRAHLTADVPVGLFLSGGIDSGAIASAARTVSEADLHSFTVVVDERAWSEAAEARQVAGAFGTTHHELRVAAESLASDLPAIIARLDQPTGDAVNSYYVSRAVAKTGIKAVLSGVGGDEMFGGYPSFERVPAGLRLARALGPAMRATRGAVAAALPAWRGAKWRHFAGEPGLAQAYRAVRGYFMPHELPALIGPALADTLAEAEAGLARAERRLFRCAGAEAPAASVARLETHGFLGSQLLRDIDAMSMAHGLEVRVPFVDHELQRVVWPALGAYPALLKGKRLLHETLARPLPPELVERPKQGFTLPFDRWLRHDLRETARDGLQALAAGGWIRPAAADEVWVAFERRQAHWSRVWGLAMLGRFLEAAP